ncbi:unnamed protein product [Choristocarpus tenellus]
MENQGIIQPSSSPWASPVSIVTKPDPRFCILLLFRLSLNKNLVGNPWPLSSMEDCLGTLGGEKYLSCLDVQSAYWQQPITDASERPETAFVTPDGKCEFKRLPFGVANTLWIYQRFMLENVSALGPSMDLLIYLDDIVLASPTWNHRIQLFGSVLSLLQQVGITLKPSKVQFGSKSIYCLGHEVSPSGIAVSPDRTQAITTLKAPKSVKE